MNCKICGISDKDYNGRFYDSGIYGRPLCSRECYSKQFDTWVKEVRLDNTQKLAQRKRCIKYYYEHQDEYKTKYKNRYHKSIGLAGAI